MLERNWTERIQATVQRNKELIEKSHRLIEDGKKIARKSEDIITRQPRRQYLETPIISNTLIPLS